MKICYYAFFEDLGEVDAFFDEKLDLISWWDCNDANFRPEYMNSLFSHFGVKMLPMPNKLRSKALKVLLQRING
jgi:hypothetical protein